MQKEGGAKDQTHMRVLTRYIHIITLHPNDEHLKLIHFKEEESFLLIDTIEIIEQVFFIFSRRVESRNSENHTRERV